MKIAMAQEPKDQLRDALGRSLLEPVMVQYVTFGPLKDGRVLRFEIYFHNEFEPAALIPSNRKKSFVIRNPRQRIVRAPIIMDAMIGCAQEPALCSDMQKYLDAVDRASTINEVPFFDDVFPASRAVFERFRGSPQWASAIQEGINSAVLVVNLHEICHAVLGHHELAVERVAGSIELEGEADGCMLEVLKLTGLSGVGGMAYIMDAVFREEAFGTFSFTHPSPRCRSLALAGTVQGWLLDNSRMIREEASRQGNVLTFPKNLDIFGSVDDLPSSCDAYQKAVERGREKGRQLFDENTNLQSNP